MEQIKFCTPPIEIKVCPIPVWAIYKYRLPVYKLPLYLAGDWVLPNRSSYRKISSKITQKG